MSELSHILHKLEKWLSKPENMAMAETILKALSSNVFIDILSAVLGKSGITVTDKEKGALSVISAELLKVVLNPTPELLNIIHQKLNDHDLRNLAIQKAKELGLTDNEAQTVADQAINYLKSQVGVE
jgi:hypothetical protein